MQPLQLTPFVASRDPELACVRVALQPYMLSMLFQVQPALSDARLGQMVREAARPFLVLDLAADDPSPDVVQWLASGWTTLLYQVGIRRLAIVAKTPAQIGPHAAGAQGVEVRVFAAGDAAGVRAFVGLPPADAPLPAQMRAASAGAIPGGASMPLALLPRAWGFPVGVATFVGAGLGAGMARLWLSLGGEAAMAEEFYYAGGALLGSVLAVSGVLAVHFARALPAARIAWDDQGIVEYVNDKPATSIAWAGARIGLLRNRVVYRNRGGVTGQSEGLTAQISDRSGKTITVGHGHQHPEWLKNRPAWVESLPGIIVARGEAIPLVRDKLGYGRVGLFVFGIVAWLSYAALFLGSVADRWAGDANAQLLFAGCGLFAIRMIWPMTKLGSRNTISALVELGLRGVVLLTYLGLALACMAHDQSR